MKEVIIKVYTIDELAEEAKQYAIDNARCSVAECLNDADGSEYREALRKIEEALNIQVYDWEVDEYRHNFRFRINGDWDDKADEERLLIRWLNNVAFPSCKEGKYFSTPSKYDQSGKYHYRSRRSKVLFEPFSCVLTGSWCTNALDDMLNNAMNIVREGRTTVREFIEQMLAGFFAQWGRDMEYNSSDEAVEKRLEINERQFLADGRVYVY